MVNTGHPSRACKLCRARRIKCDETKPHCLKCKKSKRQCPGYRDPFEINLRDETQATIRKVKAAAAAQKRASRHHEDRDVSSDESPTKSSYSRPSSNASVIRHRRSSPQLSDASWDTLSKSAWSSPSSEVAVLQSASISPTAVFGSPTDIFGSAVFDFTFPPPTQELPYDFNSTWSISEMGYSPTAIHGIASTITSSFDGSLWGLNSSPLEEPFGWSYATNPVLLPGLQTPIDEQATCFFLSNFVLSISTGQNPCLFSFIPKILQWGGIQDTPFPMAFTAVSLAALAGRPNSRHLLSTSRIYYSTALVQLKEVLKDKDRAKHDTSLAAAILLSFYEVNLLFFSRCWHRVTDPRPNMCTRKNRVSHAKTRGWPVGPTI